ncbi:MAG: beta-ketoacyl synthase N-terminal-like domain-containing protein [Prevotella sp.]|jgi:3-oxoacyl-(acyl-carrier-protein) synthase
MNHSHIVITGEGIVCAMGCNREEVTESLRHQRSGVGTMRFLQSAHQELPVGEVPMSNDEMKRRLHIAPKQTVSRTALMAMMAVEEALNDAGLHQADGLRVLLVSGTTVAGMDITENHYNDLASGGDASCLLQHDCGASSQLVKQHFDLFSDVTTISTACSSAANAILFGSLLLRFGKADVIVAGGSEALSRFHLNGFNSLLILDHNRCRPFDESRAGLNLGEGAAYVVMMREDTAARLQKPIHAYLTGWGNACDAFHQTATSPEGEGPYLAMTEALTQAGLSARDIDYVHAHGTGTPNNDATESRALQRVFGSELPPVSSTKALTGHATSAIGGIEAVICLIAMHEDEGLIPGNLGFTHPFEGGIQPVAVNRPANLRHVMMNSFGFGGNDTTLIFSKEATAPEFSENSKLIPKAVLSQQSELSDESELSELKEWMKPMTTRRMSRVMKAALLTSIRTLKAAGITTPDAIITATTYGCIDHSLQLLKSMAEQGEDAVSPTLFMQSTHNTISSAVAIQTHCQGFNLTFSQGAESKDWALLAARMLIASGRCRNVLVGIHDESTPLLRDALQRLGKEPPKDIHSESILLTCGKS